MNIGDTVKFSYIDTDNELATRDADTIYFDSNTKKISVGDVKFDGGTVPTPTSSDNGKILIAGEDGAFDWGQPPEELPIITEGDEGKVLKVDEGVPKWLEDTDNEYLLVTITRSGTSSNYTYSADKTYNEMRPFAEKGKMIAYFNNAAYLLQGLDGTHIYLKRDVSISGTTFSSYTAGSAKTEHRSNNINTTYNITIASDNTISSAERRFYPTNCFQVTDNSTMTEFNYNYIVTTFWTSSLLYDNKILYPSKKNSAGTEFDFVNYEEGIKAHIDANRLVTITEIPKDLFVTITESSGTYSADHTYNEIRSAVEAGINVYVKADNSTMVYYLYQISSTNCIFLNLFPQYGDRYNDSQNSRYLCSCSKIDANMIIISSTEIRKFYSRFFTSGYSTLNISSGTLDDAGYWMFTQIPNYRILYNNSYYLHLYYKDSTVYKFRDLANTYEFVLNVSDKSYTVTAL